VKGETFAPVPNGGMITISIMLANIMQGVDNTILNVALPHVQGSLSASLDQIAWALTSYIVCAAIMMPLRREPDFRSDVDKRKPRPE
jgi:DHA2 family multidrug resistance protein